MVTHRRRVLLALVISSVVAGAFSPLAGAQTERAMVIPGAGDRVRVTLNDGTRIEGDFVREDAEFVVILIDGVEATIDNLKVVRLEVVGDDFEQYVELRKQIGDDDVPRLISLVKWLAERQMYDEALAELDAIQQREPFHDEARTLRKTLSQLKALKDKRGTPKPSNAAPSPRPAPEDETEHRRLTAREFGLLTPAQINLIKVYEIDLANPPHVIIKRQVIDRFLQEYAEHALVPVTRDGREAFRRKPAIEILDVMFQVGARDLYGDVEVVGQPASMAMFRDVVHAGWLVNRCGTTQCHGGAGAGQLMLSNRRPRAEETVYTNFLILDRFRTSMGAPMIAWEAPERSALLQMGLPQADALYQHPKVQGWRPVFRSREDQGYVRAVEWIRSMYRPHPAYPIEYTPPGEGGRDPKALDGPLQPNRAEPPTPGGER